MQNRPVSLAPEDRVLRWIATVAVRYPRGIPVDRFVRHLKADLSPLTFAQLDGALRILEGHGLLTREWDSPGEFRVLITESGTQQAKLLEEPAPPPPRSIATSGLPPFVPPPSQNPAGFVGSAPIPTPAPQNSPPPAYRSVPIAPAPAPAPAAPYAQSPAAPPSPAPPTPRPPDPAPVSSLAGAAQGRSAGPIPTRGPPTSANVPIRVILYCLLYGAARGEDYPLVPGEDLARYLLNQGFMLSEEFLSRLFAGFQTRDLLSYLPRPTGGYDLQLTQRGHQLADGLLAGRVTLSSPDGSLPPSPPGGGARPLTSEEQLEDRWAAAEVANVELRRENEALRAALSESETRRNEDRETLDETLHQMELQEGRVKELEDLVAGMPKAPPPAPGPTSTDSPESSGSDPQDPPADPTG